MLSWFLIAAGLLGLVLGGLFLSPVPSLSPVRRRLEALVSVPSGDGWQRSPLPILALFVMLVVVAAFTMRPPLPATTVSLPIEVIGQSGHTQSVNVQVSSGNSVDRLYLQVHNLAYHWGKYAENGTDPYTGQPDQERYDEKASFRVNGGPWVDITKERVECRWPERHYDCMMGPLGNKTLRLEVEATESGAWQDGTNTIEFRFNGTEGMSSGYRILRLDVLGGSTSLLANTTFEWDDPDSWTAPLSAQSDIDEGERLWNERNILVESPLNGEQIVASCADCHTKEAHDLKYFNFSNKSIVARSEFHGLSEKQGRQIASYVRTRDPQLPSGYTVADAGRPWNPPYQPGPNLDDRPVELWAAGAGIDCVLEDDNDAASLAVPDPSSATTIKNAEHDPNFGVDCDALAERTDWSRSSERWWEVARPENNVNQREWPVAVQYPDIFEWWPDVHPYDAYGVTTVRDENWVQDLDQLEAELQSNRGGLIEEARNAVPDLAGLTRLWKDGDRLYGDINLDAYFGRVGSPMGTIDYFLERQSLQQWNAMRLWDIAQRHDLEDLGDEVYGQNSAGIDLVGAGDRTWFNNQTIYDLSPHKSMRTSDANEGYPRKGMWRRDEDREYWGDVWYDLGILLTPGQRISGDNNPIDWNYNHGHVNTTQFGFTEGGVRDGESQMTRYFKHYFVNVQQHTYPEVFPTSNKKDSWPVTIHLHGWQKFEYADPSFSYREIDGAESGADKELYHMLRQTAMKAWLHNSLQYEQDDWATTENGWAVGKKSRLAPSSYDPYLYEGYPYYRIIEQMKGEQWGNAWVGVLTRWTQDSDIAGNTRATLIDSMAVWGERMWPKYDWEQWMLDGSFNQKPSVSVTSPSDGASYTAPAALSLAASASDPDGSISSVAFYAGSNKIGESTSAPHEVAWKDVPAGSYSLTAKATDDAGATTTSSAVNVLVSSPGTPPNGVLYSYYEGDWSQLPDFASLTAVASDTTSDFNIGVAQRTDEFGVRYTSYVKIPSTETGRYTFYTSSDDGSRLLVDGVEVVNNDGTHDITQESGTVDLSAGWHEVVVEYFEDIGGEALTVSWSGPPFQKTEIPSTRLFVSPGSDSGQQISLVAGWNLVSSRVAPTDPSMSALFSPIESDLAVVQDPAGNVYDPTKSTNALDTWDASQGYRVFMRADQTLTIEGAPADPQTLDLEAGWNLIPFYPATAMPVEDAFSSISNVVEIVKDESGQSYIPARGLNEIGSLTPGRAYKVYVSSATSFTYP